MMGILGNRRKYVCNVVRLVLRLAHLSNRTFYSVLVPKSEHRFWNSNTLKNEPLKRDKSMPRQLKMTRGDKEKGGSRKAQQKAAGKESSSSSIPKRSLSASARSYTVPDHFRPGQRCASAKRELGDDLLTVVAMVFVSPWDFRRRALMRKYLSSQAHKLRRRKFYRETKTLTKPRAQALVEYPELVSWRSWRSNHSNYSDHEWGWFKKVLAEPVEDARAVCIEVIFMVRDED